MTSISEGLPSFLEYYAQHQKFGYDVAKPNTPTYQWELFNTQFGAVPQMLAVLRKFGTDAHLYLPGPGIPILGPELADFSKIASATGVTVDTVSKTIYFDGSQSDWGGPGCTNGGITTSNGKTYVVAFTLTRTAGSVKFSVGPDVYDAASGSYTRQQAGNGGSILIQSYSAPSRFVGVISGISIKEVIGYTNTINGITAGNYRDSVGTTHASVGGNVGMVLDGAGSIHASQATTGYQPKLRGGIVNLLLWSNDLSNAAWAAFGGTSKAASAVTLGNTYTTGIYQQRGFSVGAQVTAAFVVSGTPGVVVSLSITDVGGAYPNTSVQVVLTDQPTLHVVNRTLTQVACTAQLIDYGTSTTVVIGGIGLFAGTLTAQQILSTGGIPLTTTAPASSSAGAYMWEFDGVDDRFTLSSPVFQAADDYCVFASLTCKNPADTAVVFAQGAGSSRCPVIYTISGSLIVEWLDDTAAGQSITLATVEANKVYAVSVRKVGNTLYARVNAGAWQSAVYTPSTTTVTTANIGCTPAGAAFFGGNVLYVSPIKGNLSQEEVTAVERGLAALSGYSVGGL